MAFPINRIILPYDNVPSPNDNRYLSISFGGINQENFSAIKYLDFDINFCLDVCNDLYNIFEEVMSGVIPGSSNPNNSNKLLITDGDEINPTFSWIFASTDSFIISSISQIHLFDQSINEDILFDNCITNIKINHQTININNMAPDSVGTNQIVNGSITGTKLANESIGTNQFGNLSIFTTSFGNNAVGSAQIIDLSVTTIKIANQSVVSNHFQDNSINNDKLAPNVFVIPGSWFYYTSAVVPAGYIRPYGQALSRVVFANLFAVMGTTFGAGDGNTTFNVPDLRGRTMVGIGGAVINDTNGLITNATVNAVTIGGNGGSEQVTLTVPQIPAHTHDVQHRPTNMSGSSRPIRTVTFSETTVPTGGGLPHGNIQSSILLPIIMKT
jgi:hypothetical protein